MAFHSLNTELTTLIQESKRRNPELRAAAEKSLADLKGLPSTSDSQLASDLRKRPQFIKPFLLGCGSKNHRLAASSIACLQRLIVFNGLHQDTVEEVLEGLQDGASLSQDVQLRILQLLPALLQNYGGLVIDKLLATALHICFLLLASKNGIISNTAAATLQQVVISVFDRVVVEDQQDPDAGLIQDVPTETGSISVRRSALDAHRVLDDLCLLVDGHPSQFLLATQFQPTFGLELIESILANHASVVVAHPEFVQILRARLLPFIIRALSEKVSFPITVRALRLLPVILSRMLDALNAECEMVLSLVNHMLDPDAGVLWKRILCMELLRMLHGDNDLVRQIYARFDMKDGRRNIIQDQMAVMVRLASEKPSVIGLGQQSSVPYSSGQVEDEADQMAALQAEGISGTIGVAMTVKSSTAHGISVKLSNMKVPCLEQLDKNEPPTLPPSYLYGLTLICMNSFSEGLARYLLPFTVPQDGRVRRRTTTKDSERPQLASNETETQEGSKKIILARHGSEAYLKVPLNPLERKSSEEYDQILTCSAMVDSCWPALLAAYSTFFHAALDSEYYRGLVRSFQKFAQVAGLLRFTVARDAFLTTLSKNAMPSGPISLFHSGTSELVLNLQRDTEHKEGSIATESLEAPERSKASTEEIQASLNSRNLLCLRALLNLGIALGTVLHGAWVIILETLQQADFLINHVTAQRRKLRTSGNPQEDADYLADVGTEISAVAAAATRLLESTSELTDNSYQAVVSALCGLFRDVDVSSLQAAGASLAESRLKSTVLVTSGQTHDPRLNAFVVERLIKVIQSNGQRFLMQQSESNGWPVITKSLRQVIATDHLDAETRTKAAKALLMLVTLTAAPEVSAEIKDKTRLQGLLELHKMISIVQGSEGNNKGAKPCDEEIHLLGLDSMRSMLELYGESLVDGWAEVFEIISTVFSGQAPNFLLYPPGARERILSKSLKLMRSSFASLQLVCSDFLSAVPQSCTKTLITAVRYFAEQCDDFNIALTALPLHNNVAELIWGVSGGIMLHSVTETEAKDLSKILESNAIVDLPLQLLLSLVSISIDERPEIRHGAIHVSYQIIDNHSEHLEVLDWLVYVKLITLSLLQQNERALDESIGASSIESKLSNPWIETAVLLLSNTANLLSLCLTHLVRTEGFASVWNAMLRHYSNYISHASLSLSSAAFESLEKIVVSLSRISTDDTALKSIVDPVWEVWMTGNPATHTENSRGGSDNQTALSAYLSCFVELHQIDRYEFDQDKLEKTVRQIYDCAEKSSPISYAADLDSLSPLQAEIVEAVNVLETASISSLRVVVSGLCSLVKLPFDIALAKPTQKGPTFVALSKKCMEMLESQLANCKEEALAQEPEILTGALKALRVPISNKYIWKNEGKDTPTWRKATTALVSILQISLPRVETSTPLSTEYEALWNEILAASVHVISTGLEGLESEQQDYDDLSFDVDAFSAIYRLVVPALGSSKHSDDLRRQFAHILYRYSIVHEAHPDDIPSPHQEPLAALSSSHVGRTKDIVESTRHQMAYRLLEALFDLVADHGEHIEYKRLAKAAAPYLILRSSLTIKAYVLDQPLRGRMPQPASQRKEMFDILNKLIALDSEPKAIPDAPGVTCKHKKHLYWIYGLVTQALATAPQDKVMHAALTRVISTIGADYDKVIVPTAA